MTIEGHPDGRECYHCKQWIAPAESHDCWTTTEQALSLLLLRQTTSELSRTLRIPRSGGEVAESDEGGAVVEAPIADWLREAYELQDKPTAAARGRSRRTAR